MRIGALIFTASIFAALPLCTGCSSVTKGDVPTGPALDSMPEWNGRLDDAISTAELDSAQLARWWETLQDEELNSLMTRVVEANFDLRTAGAQLRKARAERNIAHASRPPSVGVGGSARRGGGSGDASTLYSASLDATWELDVFGGLKRGIEAAEADLQAAEEARRDVLVSVLAEVALNYADLRTLQRRRLIAETNLNSQQESHQILVAQLRERATTQFEVDRSRSSLETTRTLIPGLDQQISAAKNRLAVLIGQNPGTLDGELESAAALDVPDVRIAIGVPAQVLRRRPDVRATERRLAAETARVGVAIADLYPKFALTGSIGLESLSLGSLFRTASGVFGFGPAAQWNVYDGGRLREQIEVQNATQESALIEYERTVATALEEVQNAVTAFTQERLRFRSLKIAAAAAASAERTASRRYEAGLEPFSSVLDAQRASLSSEDELAQSDGQILSNLIRIYKSVGGGWTPDAPANNRR